ncbi:MAG: M48 family metalloprotease [Gammaproteobacteria bacterium]|nr:M48 family metalloprotease [Gammaproteobacteria bacterium]
MATNTDRSITIRSITIASVWVSMAMVAVLLLPAANAQSLTDLFMSPAQEKKIGAEEHERIVAQFGGVYEDPALTQYVNGIGQFLASTSGAPGVGYTFTVLDSPVVNAFALPGGYVYVTRGLVALADTEAQLAGVIAHEIAHVAARHGANRYSKNVLAGIGLAILGAATENRALTNIASIGARAVLTGYSRQDEFEADQLGVTYLARAGFNPRAMAGFLRKLEANDRLQARIHGRQAGGGLDFFSTHPNTDDRVARALDLARANPVESPIVGRKVFLEQINGLVFGDDPKQGIIQGRRFIHPEIGFEFTVPSGFKLINEPTRVLARNREGALIELKFDRLKERYLTSYVDGLWPRGVQASRAERIEVNGMDGATAIARAPTRNGVIDVRVAALLFEGSSILRLMFMTPPRLTDALFDDFRRTTYSVYKLTRSERQVSAPHRVRIEMVRARDNIDAIVQRMSIDRHARDRFLVLNGLSGAQTLEPGEWIKLVTRRSP